MLNSKLLLELGVRFPLLIWRLEDDENSDPNEVDELNKDRGKRIELPSNRVPVLLVVVFSALEF